MLPMILAPDLLHISPNKKAEASRGRAKSRLG